MALWRRESQIKVAAVHYTETRIARTTRNRWRTTSHAPRTGIGRLQPFRSPSFYDQPFCLKVPDDDLNAVAPFDAAAFV